MKTEKKRFVHYDPDTGHIQGFYVEGRSEIPEPSLEIDLDFISRVNDEQLFYLDPDTMELFNIPPTYQEELDKALAVRKRRYTVETDPLFMEWQFDQTPESELAWRNAVAVIKEEVPLPQL